MSVSTKHLAIMQLALGFNPRISVIRQLVKTFIIHTTVAKHFGSIQELCVMSYVCVLNIVNRFSLSLGF